MPVDEDVGEVEIVGVVVPDAVAPVTALGKLPPVVAAELELMDEDADPDPPVPPGTDTEAPPGTDTEAPLGTDTEAPPGTDAAPLPIAPLVLAAAPVDAAVEPEVVR
jgi:hypothetical protein